MKIMQSRFRCMASHCGSVAIFAAVLAIAGCGKTEPASAPASKADARPEISAPVAANPVQVQAPGTVPQREPAPVPADNPTDASHLLSGQSRADAEAAIRAVEQAAERNEQATREAMGKLEGT